MIKLLWYLNCMKVDKETIKRVLARNADKWNKRYAQINRLEKIKKMKKGVAIFWSCDILFSVMREIDIKIQKLEKEIMFGKWLAFDPIKDHQLKVRKFNIEKRKLLDAEAQKNKK